MGYRRTSSHVSSWDIDEQAAICRVMTAMRRSRHTLIDACDVKSTVFDRCLTFV